MFSVRKAIFTYIAIPLIAVQFFSENANALGKKRKRKPSPSPTAQPTSQPTGIPGTCTGAGTNRFRACYFNDENLSELVFVRDENAAINHDWNIGSPDGRISSDTFSARYTGSFTFEEGTYRFNFASDDGIRIFVDNTQIYESWQGQSASPRSVSHSMSAGVHQIRIEYFEGEGDASLRFSFEKGQARQARTGLVRISGNAIADDQGEFVALGASMFWAAWAYKYDREKLRRNLQFLADNGYDYIRALGAVGRLPWWAGREILPLQWPDYDEVIAGLTDMAYDEYGLRVEWTLIGDGDQVIPRVEDRYELVNRFIRMSQGREQKIMHFEIANEGWQNGFSDWSGLYQLRDLTRHMNSQTDILVAATDWREYEHDWETNCAQMRELYGTGAADIGTHHFDRSAHTAEGVWRAIRQPWEYQHWVGECGMPRVGSANEPIGPGSSIAKDDDPLRLIMGALNTYISGLPFYVFHSEAGIWGGTIREEYGVGDLYEMEQPKIFQVLKKYMPHNLPNWQRHNFHWNTSPFIYYADREQNVTWADIGASSGMVRSFAATAGDEFFVLPIGILNELRIEAQKRMVFDVIHPLTGEVLESHLLNPRQQITLRGLSAYVLKGRYL